MGGIWGSNSSGKANSFHPRTSSGKQKTAGRLRIITNDPEAWVSSLVIIGFSAFAGWVGTRLDVTPSPALLP